jgi:aspartyl protease
LNPEDVKPEDGSRSIVPGPVRRGPPRIPILLGVLALAGGAGYVMVRHDARRQRTVPLDSLGRALLRPLDRGPDPRFAAGLPPVVPRPSAFEAPAAQVMAAEKIRRLHEAIADPTDVAAFLDAQERLLWIGMGGGVLDAAKAVLAVVPDHPRALGLLAAFHYEAGLRGEIPAIAEAALRGNPGEVLALVYRGVRRADLGEFEGALEDLRRAEGIAPGRPEAAHFLGTLLFDRCRFEEAALSLAKVPAHEAGLDARVPFVRLAFAYRDLLAGREPFAHGKAFEPVEVPMELKPDLPCVPVRLNGSREGWMVLDTGSDFVRLPRREASLAATREDAAVETGGADSSSPVGIPGRLDSIEIGGLRVRDVPVLVEAQEHEPPAPGVIGSIGTAFFSRFAPTFDFLSWRLRLAPGGSGTHLAPRIVGDGSSMHFDEISFLRIGNSIHVRIGIGAEREGEFLLDTGASAITLDRALLRDLFGAVDGDPRTKPATGRGIAGRPFATFLFPLPVPLVLGRTPVHGLSVFAEDKTGANLAGRTRLAGTLGLPLLAATSLSFDFERQRIQFMLKGTPVGPR